MIKLLKWLLKNSQSSSKTKPRIPEGSEWLSWKASVYPPNSPDGFIRLNGASDISVAGTSFHLQDCRVVLSALKDERVTESAIDLVRDSSDPSHPDAIRVVAKLKHRDVDIGYLPADISDMIAHSFPEAMPLKASLREWGQKKTGDAAFFRISVFVPNARERKKYDSETFKKT